MTKEHDHTHAKRERFARIKRVKQFLRFMPRRAVMHKYPLVGRFAEVARKRAYLWSFKYPHMRPAFYAGSILSLLPLMGVQLPLALVLAVLLRANFMILGGLQFMTNPFTAGPIYYATFQLGKTVIAASGYGEGLPAADPGEPVLPIDSDADDLQLGETPIAESTGGVHWTSRLGTAFNAMIVGGVICGAALGLVLDILYRNYWHHYTLRHPPRPAPVKPPEISSPS